VWNRFLAAAPGTTVPGGAGGIGPREAEAGCGGGLGATAGVWTPGLGAPVLSSRSMCGTGAAYWQ